MAPTTYGAILVSGAHFPAEQSVESDLATSQVIQPMKWGLVPAWHRGPSATHENFPYQMINARSDTIMEKPSFRNALERGKRCVVLVDGYYEWEKLRVGETLKQPYFIHLPQPYPIDFSDPDSDFRHPPPGDPLDDPFYSYCIITVPSHSTPVSFIHERMPAILETDEAVEKWLNFKDVPTDTAKQLLKPCKAVEYYPVGKEVGNSRYISPQCVTKVRRVIPVLKPEFGTPQGQRTLESFFMPKRPAPDDETKSEKSTKAPKTEI